MKSPSSTSWMWAKIISNLEALTLYLKGENLVESLKDDGKASEKNKATL